MQSGIQVDRAAASETRTKKPSLKEILQQPNARECFRKLVKPPLDEKELEEILLAILSIPAKISTLVRRRSNRQTKLLPARLENLADEIQQVNEKSGLLYEITLDAYIEERRDQERISTGPRTRRIRRRKAAFLSLPSILRAYARYLGYAIKRHRMGWSALHDYAIWTFQEHIREATGLYHDEDVATLLTAAFRAAGQEKVASRFSGDQLRALRSRMRKKYFTGRSGG